ncbi:MAG: hypothetical protein QXY75_03055 [Candidatus Bathyarchaeia archaeon]
MIAALAHVVFGIISALSIIIHPIWPILTSLLFIIYELDEEWHLNDEAYDELKEYMMGVAIGITIMLMRITLL